MELTIQIPMEGGDTTSVKEIMESLTDEDKKQIATSVVKEWLEDDFPIERKLKEEQVIKSIRENTSAYSNSKNKTDEEIRNSWDFSKRMKDFKSSREVLISEAIKEMKSEIKEHVMEQIKSHDEVKKLKKEISESIGDELPKIIMNMFSAHLVESYSESFVKRFEMGNIDASIQNIQDRLNTNY